MKPVPRTIRDFMKLDDERKVDIRLSDWYTPGYDYNYLFEFFAVSVDYADLYKEGCVLRMKQKSPYSSLKLHYYHPRHRTTYVFKIPASDLPKDYMEMDARVVAAKLTNSAYFLGFIPTDGVEILRLFGSVEIKHEFDVRHKTNTELLDIVNQRMLDELGDKAFQPRPVEPVLNAEVIDFKAMADQLKGKKRAT